MWSSSQKNSSAVKVQDLRYLVHGSDAPFHIGSIFGISIDDWDILATHSGLFDSSNRIKKDMWGRKLQLDVDFRDFDTASTTEDRDQSLWIRFLGLSMISPGDLKATDTLAPSTSDDAVFSILQFHNRLVYG